MKNRTPVLLLALTAIFASGLLLANPHGDGRHAKHLAKLDTNGDGQVQIAEIEAHAAQNAAEIDSNRNGMIEASEVKAWHEAQRAKRAEARLLRMDANGDGKVSVDEFVAARTEPVSKRDANGDGVIQAEEMHKSGHGRRHRGARAGAQND
jgi:Ca2+-binding EF-hand superfamily protein